MSDHIMIGNAKVLIDPEDYERVNGYSWHIHTGRGTVRVKKKGMNTSMQKFILNITDKDMTAYHVNGNPWDNRKDNLRKCTLGEATTYVREFNKIRELAEYAQEWFIPKEVSFL